MGTTPTARSKALTPSPSVLAEDVIVELKPPADAGFEGTAKLYQGVHGDLIIELQKRGYVVVDR